ncbi:MAG: glycosyltransferase family 9 protein [Rhodospirillaceae bacterium]
MTSEKTERSEHNILIIKTGGIGAFVMALQAFAAIRMHHDQAEITLVTDQAVIDFATPAPFFDTVRVMPTTRAYFRVLLNERTWQMVYDLDCSRATNRLFRASRTWRQRFARDSPVPWCGVAKGCAIPHTNPKRLAMHISERHMDQLSDAGIEDRPPVSLAWVSRAVGTFSLPVSLSDPFVLIAIDPGGEENAQWSPARCVEFAELVTARGHRAVLISESAMPSYAEALAERVPDAVDLSGQASYVEVVFLAWAALAAVGNDNGLMHLIAASGCRSIVLYDPGSDAALSGHQGPDVTILRRHDLTAITAAEVMQRLSSEAVA